MNQILNLVRFEVNVNCTTHAVAVSEDRQAVLFECCLCRSFSVALQQSHTQKWKEYISNWLNTIKPQGTVVGCAEAPWSKLDTPRQAVPQIPLAFGVKIRARRIDGQSRAGDVPSTICMKKKTKRKLKGWYNFQAYFLFKIMTYRGDVIRNPRRAWAATQYLENTDKITAKNE